MSFYENKNVLVTGGAGMIGSHLAELLVDSGANVRITEFNTKASEVLSADYLKKIEVVRADLRNFSDCITAVKDVDCVFNLAGVVAGIGKNSSRPAAMYTPNIIMQTNVLEAAHQSNVERFLFQSSAAIYSSDISLPFKEDDGFVGFPEPSLEAFGWVKRAGELQAKFYSKEYGMKIGISRPFNTYGPRDNFNFDTSHMIAALVRKAESRESPLRVWGNGKSTRDFVYVTDAARGAMEILEKHPKTDPINIASGSEVSVEQLVKIILETSGYENAKIIFDENKPIGQMKRCGSVGKAEKLIGFRTKISLREGLEKTIDWYRKNKSRLKEYPQ